jgi:hypothetical protein
MNAHRTSRPRRRLATAPGLALVLLGWAPDAESQLPPLLEMSGQYLPPSEFLFRGGLVWRLPGS